MEVRTARSPLYGGPGYGLAGAGLFVRGMRMIPVTTSGDMDMVRKLAGKGFWVWLRRARSVPQGLKPV